MNLFKRMFNRKKRVGRKVAGRAMRDVAARRNMVSDPSVGNAVDVAKGMPVPGAPQSSVIA